MRGRQNALNGNGHSESLTASAQRVGQRDGDIMRRLIQPWQSRAFGYYDSLGEIKYAAQFYARGLTNLQLFAAEMVPGKPGQKPEIIPTTNEVAIAQLDRIQDPGGGRSGLLSNYGRLMFLTGEGLLFVSANPETGIEQWEMLSTDELRTQSGVYVRYRAPSLLAEQYRDPDPDTDWVAVEDGDAVAYRIWQRHPRYSALADSTMEGVLDLCEELMLLTLSVRARARSRLAGSGILFIDEHISPAGSEGDSASENPDEDPFIEDLTETMTTPIMDEGSAAAVVPLVVRVPVPENRSVADMYSHLTIIDPTQLYPETGLRMECIKRIAIGLDMPPEELLGLSDSNHWSAWQIDENTWKAHLQPKAQQLCDDLTSSFFQATLRDLGVEDWQKYVIAYDASMIINHPDRGKDANEAYDRYAISAASLREAKGFDEKDAPDDDEMKFRVGITVKDAGLAIYGVPSLKANATVETPETVEEAGAEPADNPPDPNDVEKGPPVPVDESESPVLASAAREMSVARILGSADLAVLRAREMAGNRLKSLAKRDKDALAKIRGVRPQLIAATLGPDMMKTIGAPPPRELVGGSRDLIVDALTQFGISDPEILAIVADAVEQHAAQTLFNERAGPMPASFSNYMAGLTLTRR